MSRLVYNMTVADKDGTVSTYSFCPDGTASDYVERNFVQKENAVSIHITKMFIEDGVRTTHRHRQVKEQ